MSPLWPCRWLLALLALVPGVLPGGLPGVPGCPGGALSLPPPDGRSRLLPVPPGTLPELRRRFPVLALLRSPGHREHRPEELRALELVAQALEPRGVGFGMVGTESDPELARDWGLGGRWRLALLRGHSVTEYPGELAVPALLCFLSQVRPPTPPEPRGDPQNLPEPRGEPQNPLNQALPPPVQVLVAGPQLGDFGDIEEEPKAIGFFRGPESRAFQSFSAAARRLHPSLLFFATFDPEAARALGLRPERVLLFEPFLERPRRFRGDPRDTPQMEAFLQRGRRATLRKLKAQSMAGSWEDALDGTPIVAFAKGDDPDGFEFLETLKEVAQARRDRPSFGVLWIDPGDFPGLVPSWEDTFDIDLSRPQLGVVNGTDHASSVWLRMEHEEDLPGPEEVLEWLQEVLEGDTGDSDSGDDGEGDDEDDDDDEEDEDDEDDEEDGDEDDEDEEDEEDDEDEEDEGDDEDDEDEDNEDDEDDDDDDDDD